MLHGPVRFGFHHLARRRRRARGRAAHICRTLVHSSSRHGAPCARCRPQPQDWETNPRRSRGSRPLGPIENPRDFPPGVSPYARWPPSTHPPPPYQRRRARRSHVKKFCNRTRCACGGGGHRERVSEEGGRGIFTGGDAGKHTHGDTARVGGGFNTGRHPCACVYVHISIHCMVLHACDCICMCTHSLSLSLLGIKSIKIEFDILVVDPDI